MESILYQRLDRPDKQAIPSLYTPPTPRPLAEHLSLLLVLLYTTPSYAQAA